MNSHKCGHMEFNNKLFRRGDRSNESCTNFKDGSISFSSLELFIFVANNVMS